MIDAQVAVAAAKQHAAIMLGQTRSRLEEIERDTYKGKEVWRITLGLPPDSSFAISPARVLGFSPLEYKLFLIDAEDGELVAMKLREPAIQ
jgi:hypothetical protein